MASKPKSAMDLFARIVAVLTTATLQMVALVAVMNWSDPAKLVLWMLAYVGFVLLFTVAMMRLFNWFSE